MHSVQKILILVTMRHLRAICHSVVLRAAAIVCSAIFGIEHSVEQRVLCPEVRKMDQFNLNAMYYSGKFCLKRLVLADMLNRNFCLCINMY